MYINVNFFAQVSIPLRYGTTVIDGNTTVYVKSTECLFLLGMVQQPIFRRFLNSFYHILFIFQSFSQRKSVDLRTSKSLQPLILLHFLHLVITGNSLTDFCGVFAPF